MQALHRIFFILILFITSSCVHAESMLGEIRWEDWSEAAFTRAEKEQRLVLLNLEAVWCHWCHVMEQKTYGDLRVRELLAKNYITIKVDQDSRPDLSARFRDYGWPATILFNAKGAVLAKRAGFIEPEEMAKLLKEIVADPKPHGDDTLTPGASTNVSRLPDSVRTELSSRHYRNFDSFSGGLKTSHKYADSDFVEYALTHAAQGSERDKEIVGLTLHSNLKLIDPIWGGVYQYSTRGGWDHPHYEKLLSIQATNIQLYAYGHSLFGNSEYQNAASSTLEYIRAFLRDREGAFFVSQDADLVKGLHSAEYFALDDKERRKKGVPKVDGNIYSRENGRMIFALSTLYAATGDEQVLDDAKRAAQWVIAHRSYPGGGFRHGESDKGGPFLASTLEMGRASLALYAVTADRAWLSRAEAAANYILDNFIDSGPGASNPGVLTARASASAILPAIPQRDENISVARFANLLWRYSGNTQYQNLATRALAYLSQPKVALENIVESGILLADEEIASEPLHVTIVGPKADPDAKKLFNAALAFFSTSKKTEWWDKSEGRLPNQDVEYPDIGKAAAFICTQRRCSLPVFDPTKLADAIRRITSQNPKP